MMLLYTNTLFSLSGNSWKEVLPPMPTKRCRPAAASTPTHLVVAGGMRGYIYISENLSRVEAKRLSRGPQLVACQ